MNILTFIFFTYCSFYASIVFSSSQTREVCEDNEVGTSIIQRAFEDEQNFRNAVEREFLEILSETKLLRSQSMLDTNQLLLITQDKLKDDLKLYCDFHSIIKGVLYPEIYTDFNQYFSVPLKTNKMPIILRRTYSFMLSETIFNPLLEGTLPRGYNIYQETVPILEMNENTLWGCSKGTNLKTILLTLFRGVLKREDALWEIDFFNSSLVHPLPLPVGFVEKLYEIAPQFKGWQYIIKGPAEESMDWILTFHSGYSYGGHRKYPINSFPTFAPEDCSSWVSKITGASEYISQNISYRYDLVHRDMWYAYQVYIKNESNISLNDAENAWVYESVGNRVLQYFSPLEPIIENIKPGTLFVTISLNEKQEYTGGHMGLIIEATENDNNTFEARIFNDNRNVPCLPGEIEDIDGFKVGEILSQIGGYDTSGPDLEGIGISIRKIPKGLSEHKDVLGLFFKIQRVI